MPEYLAPGVFVEEVSFRAKSIEGVSTTTTGFVGATRYGPLDIEPDIVTSLVEFERVYGGKQKLAFTDAGLPIDNYMWNAVRAFFEEGGKRLYIARAFDFGVGGDDTPQQIINKIEASYAKVVNPVPPANVAIRARFPGLAGQSRVRLMFAVSQNRLTISDGRAVLQASANRDVVSVTGADVNTVAGEAKLYVLNRNDQNDTWTFDDESGLPANSFELQHLANQPTAKVQTVTATVYVEPTVEGLPFFAAADLALDTGHRVAGKPDSLFDYFAAEPANLSDSRMIPIVIRALTVDEATVERDNAAAAQTAAGTAVTDAAAVVAQKTQDHQDALDAQAALPGGATAQQKKDAQKAVDDTDKALNLANAAKAAADTAKANADQIKAAADAAFAAANVDESPSGLAFLRGYVVPAPTANRFTLEQLFALADPTKPDIVMDAAFYLTGGNDGVIPRQAAYEGEEDPTTNRKSGLVAFEDIEDISIVAAPGSTFVDTDAQAVANVLIAHAQNMRYRIAVLDSIKGQSIADTRAYRAKFDSSYSAFYYPWVRIVDPETGQENHYPPSGFVSGIYARNDINRAVYKAPANEVVTLALGFEKQINKAQQEVLNPEGVNCFRYFEGRGMRLWGARTMSSDPEWKYVNLRRYFAYLERSIDKGTQWAVFEPNGERLWANVKRTISDFLLNEWQSGALLGDKPEKAFFVKCDRSTMTQNNLDNGQLVCLVGVAALKPAEFVIFRIGQWTADSKA
ncbi:phage tail sheath subtilisin-like domain-containing protein [Sphingomonas sp.]|uniref:phage tail sheath family protein n=1 Tax=Sphingomonas sp. TaxID=28214 RepID=UPI0025DA5071|nr:phage tail sheath subtilisin-like domain-containing protein [Sphingomonas sp.]